MYRLVIFIHYEMITTMSSYHLSPYNGLTKKKKKNIECIPYLIHYTPMVIFLFYFIFVVLGPHPWHVEVQARGQIGTVATGLHHSHSNAGAEMHL